MIYKILDKMGIRLFNVILELQDRTYNPCGYISITLYAASSGHARRRAIRRLNRAGIFTVGSWHIMDEIV